MALNGNEAHTSKWKGVPSSIIVEDKTSLLTMWKKKKRIVKRAAKQVPRDKGGFTCK